ncbi:hypothetical protein FYK55_14710 [Roseiconus nitratireducens]|uniref:Uncharacterized protein n=1 Tax=Roseiconus nitratireducens TaxID=2605748 RepID=A0A5M6D5I1_9BACT|nr:hypothetical protein [Roseiconus nitratireducens]KAA5542768.1 hypothetical protein FYK55_14710 [Roseiconus nitratireducens]
MTAPKNRCFFSGSAAKSLPRSVSVGGLAGARAVRRRRTWSAVCTCRDAAAGGGDRWSPWFRLRVFQRIALPAFNAPAFLIRFEFSTMVPWHRVSCHFLSLPVLVAATCLSLTNPSTTFGQDQPAAEVDAPVPEALRATMVLRISEDLLQKIFARDIDRQTPVDRCILGTHSRGTAVTTGHADVETKHDIDDGVFQIQVRGTTRSRTVGRNGPAIIHSQAVVNWTVAKVIRFDQGQFITRPGSIRSDTTLNLIRVDSSLPGLRGALVRRIANKRYCQQKPTATAIVDRLTRQQILDHINHSLDERIEKLNHRIQSRPFLSYLLNSLDSPTLHLSTSENCLRLAFLDDREDAPSCPLEQLDPSDTELWIHASLFGLPDLKSVDLPAIDEDWMKTLFPDMPLAALGATASDAPKAKASTPLAAQWVDQWIVLRPKLAPEMAQPEVAGETSTGSPEQK